MMHDASLTKAHADAQFLVFWCAEYGLEIAQQRNVWPTKKKNYVGIVIDSELQEVSLTEERRSKYVSHIDDILKQWGGGAVQQPRVNPAGARLLDMCGGVGTTRHALEHSLRRHHGNQTLVGGG